MSSDIVFVPDGVTDDFAVNSGLGFGYISQQYAHRLYVPRNERAHKGTYGHALLVCGSRGMIGAATLAVGAALRSGCGIVTAHIPAEERFAVSANYPSALLSLDDAEYFSELPASLDKYNAIGVGCGLAQSEATVKALAALFETVPAGTKLVIDADALNICARHAELKKMIPPDSILTPHEQELERLVGKWTCAEEKIRKASRLAADLGSTVLIKGPNTMVCVRGEYVLSNSTGNAGMAKGGSGDVLTGFLAGLLARGYQPEDAAALGVYVHGLAGDKARDFYGEEGMNSTDIIEFLGEGLADIE